MIEYIKEKWQKNYEQAAEREDTFGDLVVSLTINPIIMVLGFLSIEQYGLKITLLLIAIFFIVNTFLFGLDDIIFFLMGKKGLKKVTKFPMRKAKPWMSWVVTFLVLYFLLRNN